LDKKKSIIIAGNGPSITQIDYRRLPKEYDVLRINNFYFEDKYYLGKKVDYYYTDYGFIRNQFFNIYNLKKRGEYDVYEFLTTPYTNLEKDYPHAVNIMNYVYKNKKFGEFISYYRQYYKKLVTSGILSLFAAIEMGYKDIYVIGIDLYQNNMIYPWESGENYVKIFLCDIEKEENITNVMNKYHMEKIEIEALELAKNTPGVKLYSLSEQSPINNYIDLSIIQNDDNFIILDKEPNALKDWLDLPVIEEETIESEQKVNLKKINFIQKIFSVKNEDNHKVLRVIGIKFKFKRKSTK